MPIFRTVINQEVKTFQHEELSVVVDQVCSFYENLNIKFNRKDLIEQIKRQTNSPLNKRPIVDGRDKKSITIREAFQGAKALLKFSIGDSASRTEIERRSLICDQCPLKEQTTGCSACGASKNVANVISLIQNHKKTPIMIPNAIKSQYCGVCSCSLAVMVVTKYKDFDSEPEEKNQQRPDKCWLKKTSQNFTNE